MSAARRRRDFLLYYAVQRLSLTKNFHRDPDSIRKIYLSCFITSAPYYNKAERVTVRFSFSCTSLLYYILCLCKSFKELFPFGAQTPAELSWGASLPVCGCKGTSVSGVSQASAPLFYRLNETFLSSHYIYIARAKLFWDIRGIFAVSGVVWDGGRRKRFLYLSEQYYFPWRWSITSVADEVLLLSHLKYYSCFNTTFLGVCQSNSSPCHFPPPIPCGDRSYLACRQTFSLPAPN